MATADETPWHAAFPDPKAKCAEIEPEVVSKLLKGLSTTEHHNQTRDFLLVDVRRTDWEGGTVATSINLPAQSLYPTRSVIYQMVKQAGVKQVIFYCGSSNGRGPRSAAWLQDYIDEVGDQEMKALVMKGGIKGWVRKYGGHHMDWYDEKFWAEKKE
ncbi:hypothetical protein E1B28_012509 [Marasmius oreades]|uniref:Rhodanese domain-containing protein n=1 Tax=Marasmius oreades TaxID=181124 RepID=A0A9P7RRM6_9AGAR|nr:uncharacterized protein E1B28_012509 [Marasmius oreades]KAG7088526.1 hypothetical protein E1B28_012509 [Marasmius oreades]